MNIDYHTAEIMRLRREADKLADDNPADLQLKIETLSKCLVFVGRLSSHLCGEYKRIYARRKLEYAKAEVAAKPPRASNAEIAIAEWRDLEAQSYEDMHRWKNAFESTREEIHALKLRSKNDMEDGHAH